MNLSILVSGSRSPNGPMMHPAALTMAHNVDSPDEVTALAHGMAGAGGAVLKAPQPGQFGGVFHAHVQDLNGLIWEIAHNLGWRIEPDGAVRLGSTS